MRHVFNSHSELAHIYAQQKQEYGRAGNMYFEGTKIYSYGPHYCIANFIEPKLVAFNCTDVSVSTSQHKNLVRSALHDDVKIIPMPYPDNPSEWRNIDYWVKELDKKITEDKRAKTLSRFRDIKRIFNIIEFMVDRWPKFRNQPVDNRENFEADTVDEVLSKKHGIISQSGKRKKVLDAKFWVQEQRLQERRERERREMERVMKEREEREKQKFRDWIGDDSVEYSPNTDYIRISHDGKWVETWQGARVPVKEAKILNEKLKKGEDVKGFEIYQYTVIGYNGELHIGCHHISRHEIERFREKYNW